MTGTLKREEEMGGHAGGLGAPLGQHCNRGATGGEAPWAHWAQARCRGTLGLAGPRPDGSVPGWASPQTGPSWPGAAQGAAGRDGRSGGQDGGSRRQHLRPLVLAAVAVVALAAGVGGALAVARGLSSPSSAATPASGSPSSSAPGAGGGPFPGGGAGQTGRLFLGGTVVAVSTTSITISGPGHTVTAAVTAATRVTGKVTSISSVKVGDRVSAQITESGGKATAAAIQDPASLPSSGGLP